MVKVAVRCLSESPYLYIMRAAVKTLCLQCATQKINPQVVHPRSGTFHVSVSAINYRTPTCQLGIRYGDIAKSHRTLQLGYG